MLTPADQDTPSPEQAQTSGPFPPKQLRRLNTALTAANRETGLNFSVFVGDLGDQTRDTAEQLHTRLGSLAADSVLIAVSPGQRVLEIITGEASGRRLPDRSCALAALSMTAAFDGGDLIGGLVTGVQMLADQAGRLDL